MDDIQMEGVFRNPLNLPLCNYSYMHGVNTCTVLLHIRACTYMNALYTIRFPSTEVPRILTDAI